MAYMWLTNVSHSLANATAVGPGKGRSGEAAQNRPISIPTCEGRTPAVCATESERGLTDGNLGRTEQMAVVCAPTRSTGMAVGSIPQSFEALLRHPNCDGPTRENPVKLIKARFAFVFWGEQRGFPRVIQELRSAQDWLTHVSCDTNERKH